MSQLWKYFAPDEVQGLDTELCAMLDRARGLAGIPFIITSGLRTVAENEALSESVKDSAHLSGHAVDLACADSVLRYAMLRGLLLAGFHRIGIYSAHVHADNDLSLPPNVIWVNGGT
jgi:zinc D-Ala-D-Ala carboxypeptidase